MHHRVRYDTPAHPGTAMAHLAILYDARVHLATKMLLQGDLAEAEVLYFMSLKLTCQRKIYVTVVVGGQIQLQVHRNAPTTKLPRLLSARPRDTRATVTVAGQAQTLLPRGHRVDTLPPRAKRRLLLGLRGDQVVKSLPDAKYPQALLSFNCLVDRYHLPHVIQK